MSISSKFIKYAKDNNLLKDGISNIFKIPDDFRTTNGCAWCRTDNISKSLQVFKYLLIKKYKKGYEYNYGNMIESENNIDELKLDELFKEYPNNNSVIGFKFCGIILPQKETSSIRRDIRKQLLEKYKRCVNCGHNKDLQIDHKNDLKNNPRVLNIKTQLISDFQVLCNKCNTMKRGDKDRMIKTGKRISGTEFYFLTKFIKGNYILDINDPNCLVGSYWYDCEEFKKIICNKNYDIVDEFDKLSI